MSMFCFQCQETAKGSGCTIVGVCGKTSDVSNLQDLLIYATKGVSFLANIGRKENLIIAKADKFVFESLFTTITNANFDQTKILSKIYEGFTIRDFVLDALSQRTDDAVRDIDTDIVAASAVWKDLDDVRTAIDVGTGSGCIAITLACEQPELRIIATDVSQGALDVAKKNAERHGVLDRIDFLHGSLLEPISDQTGPFIVVSNPPYIPDGEDLQPDVDRYEPTLALRAGTDGTDVIKELAAQAHAYPQCRGILIECKESQVHVLR